MLNFEKITLFVLYFAIIQISSGQSISSDSLLKEPLNNKLQVWERERIPLRSTENSIGVVSSIQGANDLYLGMAISRGFFTQGEFGGGGIGTSFGVDYNPKAKILVPKANLWFNPVFGAFGLNLGVNGSCYIKKQETNFVLRPEIGIGYYKVLLIYGRNLFINDDFSGISKHSITLSYYHTILYLKKNKNKF